MSSAPTVSPPVVLPISYVQAASPVPQIVPISEVGVSVLDLEQSTTTALLQYAPGSEIVYPRMVSSVLDNLGSVSGNNAIIFADGRAFAEGTPSLQLGSVAWCVSRSTSEGNVIVATDLAPNGWNVTLPGLWAAIWAGTEYEVRSAAVADLTVQAGSDRVAAYSVQVAVYLDLPVVDPAGANAAATAYLSAHGPYSGLFGWGVNFVYAFQASLAPLPIRIPTASSTAETILSLLPSAGQGGGDFGGTGGDKSLVAGPVAGDEFLVWVSQTLPGSPEDWSQLTYYVHPGVNRADGLTAIIASPVISPIFPAGVNSYTFYVGQAASVWDEFGEGGLGSGGSDTSALMLANILWFPWPAPVAVTVTVDPSTGGIGAGAKSPLVDTQDMAQDRADGRIYIVGADANGNLSAAVYPGWQGISGTPDRTGPILDSMTGNPRAGLAPSLWITSEAGRARLAYQRQEDGQIAIADSLDGLTTLGAETVHIFGEIGGIPFVLVDQSTLITYVFAAFPAAASTAQTPLQDIRAARLDSALSLLPWSEGVTEIVIATSVSGAGRPVVIQNHSDGPQSFLLLHGDSSWKSEDGGHTWTQEE